MNPCTICPSNARYYLRSTITIIIIANTSGLPEKVNFAVKFAIPGETLLGEVAVAFAALHTLGVPRAVQYVK